MKLRSQTSSERCFTEAGTWTSLDAAVQAGHWTWQGALGRARFRFYGRSTNSGEKEILQGLADEGLEVAHLRQQHSNEVVEARPGDCGDGDALVTSVPGLALRIITADCVPVLLLSNQRVAAIHAGWRGIHSRVINETALAWRSRERAHAVIGPAIGRCCYEVGKDVASSVATAVATAEVIVDRGDCARPHLDLAMSVQHQLEATGAIPLARVDSCTRCDEERLWSYRREGPRSGRNLAFVWLAV